MHTHVAADQCPWCGTEISRSKFLEIEGRIAERERKKLAEERVRMELQLRAEIGKTAARDKDESEKKLAVLSAKLKTMEERETTFRKEAAAQAEAKLKQLEATKQKEIEHQRALLEKDRDVQVLKVQADNNREREKLQQKIDALTRQVQRKTAGDLGDGAEIDIYEALRDAFPADDISRIKKGQPGADIRQIVQHKGQPCGKILIDSKNRQGWQDSYVTKLREDQVNDKAEYAILATSIFKSGKKELYVDADTRVVVVSRARTVDAVSLIRALMLRLHSVTLSHSKRSEKQAQLYEYISSDDFRQHLMEAGRLTSELSELDVEEKRSHEKVWERRGKTTTRLRNVAREIDVEVSAILDGRRS
jgi:hypothetical protein